MEANTEFQESLWLNFKLQNGDNLLFGNVYRSPISSEENDGALNLVMGNMCSPAPGRFSHICVVGDFNFPLIRWSATHATPVESKEGKFIDIIEECYLYQQLDQLDVGVKICPANWILFLQMNWRWYLMCSTWHHW